jgi:hypothetical protein
MASLIRILPPDEVSRSAEQRAHEALGDLLPISWILTTNVPRYTFAGFLNARELDSVLITPLGIFVLDFKEFRLPILPRTHDRWVRSDGKQIKNPFRQIDLACMLLKEYFERSTKLSLWIEGLIVVTNDNGFIDWKNSDVPDGLIKSVVRLHEVEQYVRKKFSERKRKLDARQAQRALDSLKPFDRGIDLFSSWNEPATDRAKLLRFVQRCLKLAIWAYNAKAQLPLRKDFVVYAAKTSLDLPRDQFGPFWNDQYIREKERVKEAYFASTEGMNLHDLRIFPEVLVEKFGEDPDIVSDVVSEDSRLGDSPTSN